MKKLDKKAVVASIKKLIFTEDLPMSDATEYTLQDGTKCTIDKMEVGGAVMIAGVAAVDGVYTLEDGTAITVVAGLISEITAAAVEPTEPTEPTEMSTPEQMQAAINKFADEAAAGKTPDLAKMAVVLKAVFEYTFGWQLREASEKATREAAIATYQSGFKALGEKVKSTNEANKLLLGLLEEFMDGETEKPTEVTLPENFESLTPLEKRRAFRAATTA